MFFVYGTEYREEPRGWVADRCPGCDGRISAFQVRDHYRSEQAYFVVTTEDWLMATSATW